MIIQILSNLFEEGYLDREKYTPLSSFFAGANVAFRRRALSEVGAYDTNCFSGEDQDMCLRVARAGWELYFAPKALVRHKNKMRLRAFIRKWFDYGFYHPYIFRKHAAKGFRVYTASRGKKRGESIYRTLFGIRFPLNAHIFFTTFLTMHLLLLLALLLTLFGLFIPAIITGVTGLVVAACYFRSDITREKLPRGAAFIFLRYTANLALLAGGFLGGVRLKMIYISATFDGTS